MEIMKKLNEIDPRDLPIVERLFGQQLDPTSNVVLILRDGNNVPKDSNRNSANFDTLPDWCDMYAGLSDAQIADLESVVLQRADLARSID